MIDNTMQAGPNIRTNHFHSFLHHSVFPPAWKNAKFVPIPKPGRTDLLIPNHL